MSYLKKKGMEGFLDQILGNEEKTPQPKKRVLKECHLYQPVKDYFKSKGFKVVPEVNLVIGVSDTDLVALNDKTLISVELKMTLSKKVIEQAYRRKELSDFVYIAVPTNPRSIKLVEEMGIGVIKVSGNNCKVILEASRSTYRSRYADDYRIIAESKKETDSDVGGTPTMKGVGPRIECAKKVKQILEKQPNKTWPEMFKNIENHYCSAASMKSSVMKYFECKDKEFYYKLTGQN